MEPAAFIKWGILGTSYISEVMAKAIDESKTSKLLAIGSRSELNGKNFANKFSIPKMYVDYQQLLDDDEIDAVYIGLPNHLHKKWIMLCAEAGKHILCEKPLVINCAEMQEVFSVIKKTNVFCMEALMYRCHPFIKKIQEIIQNNIIGDIKLYNAFYAANIAHIANTVAGGSIRNLGCYPVSLVRLLAQSEPIEIIGQGRLHKIYHSDNQASVILKFPNHSLATISTADDLEMNWHFDVYGEKGILKIISNPWLPTNDNNKLQIFLNNETLPTEINITADKSLYTYQIDYANSQIMKKEAANSDGVSLDDSFGNVRVLETWFAQIQNS